MLTEMAMSLAGPWPLKIVLDHAVGPQFALGGLEVRPSVDG